MGSKKERLINQWGAKSLKKNEEKEGLPSTKGSKRIEALRQVSKKSDCNSGESGEHLFL